VRAPEYAPHVINTPLAFLIKSALNTNIFGEPGWMGTGWRAGRDLQRHDIGGKTGTTNSSKDAWFSGYGPGVVTSVWIGFDDHRRDLGRTTASGAIKDQISGYEGGAKSAQPAWDDFMKSVLEGVPEEPLTPPPGITVNIDRSTGQLASGGNSRAEYFIEGTQPTQQAVHEVGTTITDGGGNPRTVLTKKRLRALFDGKPVVDIVPRLALYHDLPQRRRQPRGIFVIRE
jgi:penicillin-binding protein 1A